MSLKEKYQVGWDVNGGLAAVERLVGDCADDLFRCVFDYGYYDVQIGCNCKKFYLTFNFFKLIKFTFKYRLCITH